MVSLAPALTRADAFVENLPSASQVEHDEQALKEAFASQRQDMQNRLFDLERDNRELTQAVRTKINSALKMHAQSFLTEEGNIVHIEISQFSVDPKAKVWDKSGPPPTLFALLDFFLHPSQVVMIPGNLAARASRQPFFASKFNIANNADLVAYLLVTIGDCEEPC